MEQKQMTTLNNFLPQFRNSVSSSTVWPALIADLQNELEGKSYAEFKRIVASNLVSYLEPFARRRKEFLTREVYVNDILKRGAARAQTIASATMQEVKKAMGLA